MKINTGVYMSGTQQTKLNLYQKLVEVRKSTLYISKAEEGFKFKYANGADILASVRPSMDEMGVLLVTNMEHFELMQPKGMLVTMSYTWINAENPAEQLRTSLSFYEDKMTGCQGVGSILTYGERYFMYKFFNVATDSDSPEKFYDKQGWSAIEEEQPKEKAKLTNAQPVKPVTYTLTIETCEKAAEKLWELLKKNDAEMKNWLLRDELAYYIFFMQKRTPGRNVLEDLKEQAKTPRQVIQAMDVWLENHNGKRDMEELQWSRAQPCSQTKSA